VVNSKQNDVLLIDIAQECYVSVRDIHMAAKELGQELPVTARTVDAKLAKMLVNYLSAKRKRKRKKKRPSPRAKRQRKKKRQN